MPWRICLGCGAPAENASRCPACRAVAKRIRNADQPIAKQVVAQSPICSCKGCSVHPYSACGATQDLTADHVVPLARGGKNTGRRRTLCRSCNSARGAR